MPMMRRLARMFATTMVLVGSVWSLQGLGVLGGSAMSGDPLWGWIGSVLLLGGLGLGVWGMRQPR